MTLPKYSDYRAQLTEIARTEQYISSEARTPVTINWRGYELPFKELHFAADGNEDLIGGILARETSVRIGPTDYVITEINFYRNSDLDPESIELARNAIVEVGGKHLEFENTRTTAGLSFHPNGAVMSGKLAEPISFEVGGNTYTFSSIGFNEDGSVSGGMPIANTMAIECTRELIIVGAAQDFFDRHTVSFSNDGHIEWADLADGTTYQRGA